MSNKLTIKVNIAERPYPLTIDINEEEKIRRAARMINDKILQYKQRFVDKDNQDFLAMVLLHYVTQLIDNESKYDISAIITGLIELNNDVDSCIKNSKINVL